MLRDHQVFDDRHFLEQANVLERTDHALARHLEAGQALDLLATEQDLAVTGLVEPGQAVEHRGLSCTVGADH